MRTHRLIIFLLAFFSLSFMNGLFASPDSSATRVLYQINLRDGSKLVGSIVKQDSSTISFKTAANISIEIPRDQVESIRELAGSMVRGRYYRPDPNQTRLLFAPTARTLKSGQGYFSAYQIFFPFVAVGVTGFITLAGGMSLLPGANEQLFYLAPKIRFAHLQDFDLAGGILYIAPTGADDSGGGIAYGVTTYGSAKTALTLGLGWGFAGDDFAEKPVVMIGGEVRTSHKTKLISENWLIPDSDVNLLSFGIRFFGENLAADFALIYPTAADMDGFPFFPWVGFAYNFGSK